ncbi:MAG TPA: biotin/lipoyl-binding protein, partial [Chitinophagaceae bacterium]|nr:biotin/lipoyl-binding protein [Chitinophagaceae bacterium]
MMPRYGYLIVLLFGMVTASCGDDAKTAAPATGATGLDTVPAFLLTKKKIAKKTELPAELLPYEQADISARVQGYIREMKVDIGDRVHKGQVLAVVDAPEVNTQSSEYEASLQAAKAKYNASADHYQRLARASQAKT